MAPRTVFRASMEEALQQLLPVSTISCRLAITPAAEVPVAASGSLVAAVAVTVPSTAAAVGVVSLLATPPA